MTVAYGLFALNAVLGWSALFLRGASAWAIIAQWLWLALLIGISLISPLPWVAAAGAATGAFAHLFLQTYWEGRTA